MEEMTCKFIIFSVLWSVIDTTTGGVVGLESDTLHRDHHVSVASSYMHFHGPVVAPEFEVKVPYVVPHSEHNHLHGQDHGYSVDYIAHPKYQYSYGVEDYHSGDFHSQKESRDGSSVSGEYSVLEPGGRIRTVKYHADKDGFHAVVHTAGKNDHSGGSYTVQGHEAHSVESHEHLDDYAAHAVHDNY